MYEQDDQGHITCVTCGNKIVTVKSHEVYCRGFMKEPWQVLSLTKDRLEHWKASDLFLEWAGQKKIDLSAF
jgi:hypothetical protein